MTDERIPESGDASQAHPIADEVTTGRGFPIVGIGASAGGLDAFEQFFTNMPPDSGMAFVLVQHLDPTHESILVNLVQRHTRMPVQQVADGMRVEANHIYVIPPNRDMALLNGQLRLMEPAQRRGLRLPIDFFFRSLAEDQKDHAICIVLSGTGSDGTLGLKAIKGEGGIALAQEPATAKYDGMPHNAVSTGLVDYVLPPKAMPEQLLRYVRHAFAPDAPSVRALLTHAQGPRHDIFELLRQRTGHDFSAYKPTTIGRRIERRMAVNQIARMEDYVRLLHEDAEEVQTLFRELLIGVTRFFRDPDAFEVLERDIIPQRFADLPAGEPLRVWVPGCATGEEAYSIAILLAEYLERHQRELTVQIFATDIDEQAIDRARAGVYPHNIAADVSPERLQRYFAKEGHGYQLNKRIRDSIVFAVQSVVKDPPFSNLDLISCRNVLIYLDTSLQERVLSLFHYALKPGGFLFLGKSESLGKFTEEFEALSSKYKLFQRLKSARPLRTLFTELPEATLDRTEPGIGGLKRGLSLRDTTHKLLLEQYAPPCLIVNEEGDILYIYGRMGKYLEPTTGEPTMNVLHVARGGLRMPLATALRKATASKARVVRKNVAVQTNGDRQSITLIVQPLLQPAAMQGLMQILFEETEAPAPLPIMPEGEEDTEEQTPKDARARRIIELEDELRSTREYLQTITDELETSNEELLSTNEELQSSNEDLQSTNEELETSKEELQSINEELMTVNNKLKSKIEELTHANEDISNLLNSVAVGIIFLDRRLQIQRFNPPAQKVVNLIDTDVGRPVHHLVTNLAYDTLRADCERVLETLEVHETEVRTHAPDDVHWYTLRIQPYYTLNKDVAGLVLTFADVTAQKQMQIEIARLRQEELRALVENSPDLVVRFDRELRHLYINPTVTQLTDIPYEDYVGQTNRDLGMPEDTVMLWDAAITQVFETGEQNEIEFDYEAGDGRHYFHARLSPVLALDGTVAEVLSIARDITARRQTMQALRESEMRYRAIFDQAAVGIAIVHPEGQVITEVNDKLCAILGYTKEELLTLSVLDITFSEDLAQEQQQIQAGLTGQSDEFIIEKRYVHKQGHIIWANLSSNVVRDAEGQIQFIIGAVVDITERKQAETALRESKALLDAVGQMARVGGWELDVETRDVTWTEQTYRIHEVPLGHRPSLEEAISFYPPEDRSKLTDAIQRAIDDGEPYDMEIRFITATGKPLRVRTICSPRVVDGKTVKLMGTFHDITARKHAEEALIRSEQFLQNILNYIPDPIFVKDSQHRWVLLNDAYCAASGYSRKMLLGKSDYDFYPKEQADIFWEKDDKVLASGDIDSAEEKYTDAAGNIHTILTRKASFVDHEGNKVLVGIATDITARQQMEDALRESESRLRAILKYTSVIIYLKDTEGHFTSVNRAFERAFGISQAEVVGKTSYDLVPAEIAARHEAHDKQVIQAGTPLEFEETAIEADGQQHVVLSIKFPMYSDEGDLYGVGGISTDITARKRLERDRERYAAELERSNEALDEFAYIVSHDLRTPLRMITSFLGLLQSQYQGQLDEEADEYIAFAVDGAENMDALIAALLEYARIGTQGQAPVPTDADAVLAETLHTLQFDVEESDATVTHDSLPPVLVDPIQLGQLFQNLVANALKFHRLDVPPRINIAAERAEDAANPTWIFSVQDNGIGIPKNQYVRIFGIFQRLHTREEYEGTGIGLAVCKKIVERHGGRMWVESEVGKGTTFYFTLPAVSSHT